MDTLRERTGTPEAGEPELPALSQGLAQIRKRRWLLWAAIIIYLPGLYLALEFDLAGGTMIKLFWAWVGLLCITVGLATVVKCPRCRNQFHTNGPTFFPVRKCLHCGLHLKADKSSPRPVGTAS